MEGPILDLGLGRLADAAAGGLLVLAAGSLAVRLGREPVRRVRLVVLTLLGAASLPLLASLPLAPRWSIGPATGEPAVSAPTIAPRATSPTTEDSGPIPARPARPAEARPEASPSPAAPPPAPAGPTAAAWRPSARVALATAYGLGALGWGGWWLVGQLALARASRSARPAPASVRGVLREVAGGEVGADRVRLLVSDRIALPFTFTWARPVILLPASLCDPAEDRALRYALAHEWSHVARRDARSWNLAWLAGLVLFYQPLYWWLRRQLRLCQDFLADDRAAAVGSAEDYAAFLVRLARARGGGPAWPALGIGDRRSNLYRRVVMLVQDREPLETRCRAAWSLAAAATAALVAVVASGLRLDAAPTAGPVAQEGAPMPTEPPRPAGEALNYKGIVKDKDTGKPIAGATVTVRREISTSGQRRILQETRHVTAEDGTYSFTIPPEQASEPFLYIELDVEHPDYATRAGFGYSLAMTRKNEGLGERPFFETIEMRPAKPVFGKVETPDGRPAEGVELLSYSRTDKVEPPNFEYGSFVRVKTDADGMFRLPLTTPGDAVIWVLPKDFAPEMHGLTDGRRGDLGTFRLKPGVKIAGQAFDVEGKPIQGLLLRARRERPSGPDGEVMNLLMVADEISRIAETDSEGRFAFDPLPAGDYRIVATDFDARRDRSEGWARREIPGVFEMVKLTLKEGEAPGPIVLRESPHVVVEGRWVDSQGRPKSGWSSVLFGQTEAGPWMEQTYPDAQGVFRLNVPRGLKQAQLDISTNEHASVRHRAGKDAPLQEGRSMQLGALDRDVKDIEIVRYASPVVVIDAVDESGKRVAGFQATAAYVGEGPEEARRVHLSGGRPKGEAIQDEQNDGRYRTSQLLPDREVAITVTADGFEPATRTLKLPEGAKEEVSLVLKPK